MFRILVVDDDPNAGHLLQAVMKNIQRPHELRFVGDGVEALDFLHGRGACLDAPRPNLILLDLNMPRLGGLETLSAIKNDPDLRVIPVIILSAASSPQDVRSAYEAHANCYVQKPTNLERSVKFVQAVEAFWMDFAILSSSDELTVENLQSTDSKQTHPLWAAPHPREARSGPTIAAEAREEACSRAKRIDDPPAEETATRSRTAGCEEHKRLLDDFGKAVQELLKLHKEQFQAIVEGDTESHRIDLLIHMANQKKQAAKYDYLRHVEAHGCANTDAIKQTRT